LHCSIKARNAIGVGGTKIDDKVMKERDLVWAKRRAKDATVL